MSCTLASNGIAFEKYVIHKDYHVTMWKDGREITLIEEEAKNILDTDFLAGSLAFSRDTKHNHWLHVAIHIGLKILYFFRKKPIDLDICHGVIILGAKKDPVLSHPYLIAHSIFEGICTAKRDHISEVDVTELLIYRPKDEKIRARICENAERTAFVKKKSQRTALSPEKKSHFSWKDLIVSGFRNRKRHQFCQEPTDEVKNRTALIAADLLLGTQLLNEKGSLRPLFCSAYTMAILQGSILTEQCQGDKGFSEGLTRLDLAAKIKKCFDKKASFPENSTERALQECYWSNKIIRVDARYAMSPLVSRMLDKLSCEWYIPLPPQAHP